MEFTERKRSRKSQSFKLVNEEDFEAQYSDSTRSTDVNGGMKDVTMTEAWLGDEGMEIKKQITGMMRLLNAKTGRAYQRVGKDGESLKQEPQDVELGWAPPPTDGAPGDPQLSAWSPEPVLRPQASGQYGTRSKTLKTLADTKNAGKPNAVATPLATPLPSAAEPSCCMCNCKGTLQAVLKELRAMRKLMQTQKGAQEKPQTQNNTSHVRSPAPRKRPRKRRPVHKVAPPASAGKRAPLPVYASPEPSVRRERVRERSVLVQTGQSSLSVPAQSSKSSKPGPAAPPAENPLTHYSLNRDLLSSEPEVQLSEDYDVYISKSQLDSILLNYTRSGSLLFRKLVCAFFDDATLANSLPNGKRKRGLNDNRKGLDQNIVGAIKVFTEKYCTANRIEKLPGPRDWVQILQDQIKLARRRLKRGNGEGCRSPEEMKALQSTGNDPEKTLTQRACFGTE